MEEHLQNDLFCIEWDVKPYPVTSYFVGFILGVFSFFLNTVIVAVMCAVVADDIANVVLCVLIQMVKLQRN